LKKSNMTFRLTGGHTAMHHWLGVKPSYSRLRVCDDNAYVEARFHRPEFPKISKTKPYRDALAIWCD